MMFWLWDHFDQNVPGLRSLQHSLNLQQQQHHKYGGLLGEWMEGDHHREETKYWELMEFRT